MRNAFISLCLSITFQTSAQLFENLRALGGTRYPVGDPSLMLTNLSGDELTGPKDVAVADLGPAVKKAIAVSAARKFADLPTPIQISEVQRLLAKLDFRPGPPDGVLGHRTVKAIRLYQKFGGLEITGHATPDLLLDLRAVASRMPEPAPWATRARASGPKCCPGCSSHSSLAAAAVRGWASRSSNASRRSMAVRSA